MNVKILTFNMHKGVGWIKKFTLPQIKEQINILQPDIIFLQEVCATQSEFLSQELFPYFSYGKNVAHAKGHHGNAILSKFPISFSQNIDISMGRYERRGLLHTVVHPNHSRPVHLLCVHLGLLRKDRDKQLEKMVKYVEEHIPANEPLIIGGDFNDWRSYATKPMIERLGLQEPFLQQNGSYAKTFPAWSPLLRLDRIYTRGFIMCEAERLIDRSWRILSDHIALNVNLEFST